MKKCLTCRKILEKKPSWSWKYFQKQKYCSYQCYWKSKEFRNRIKLTNKGNKYCFGKKLSEETKQKIGNAHRGKKRKPFAKETRQKMSKWQIGDKSWRWKGGKKKDNKGYILIKKWDHPFHNASGYVYEHRLIMEKYLGRYLRPEEKIHHTNKNPADNRIENLKLFSNQSQHIKSEWKLRKSHKL